MSAERNLLDALVVGAGPAGAAAAITLARAGRSVVVVDRAEFPRDKCCGDGLTTLALREVEALGLDPTAVADWRTVHTVVLRSPSGRIARLPMPTPGIFAATTPRRQFDHALVRLAREAGAVVHEGHAVSAVHQHPDRVDVEVDGLGTLSAHHLIAADGVWSPTRKLLGIADAGYRGEWHAFRQYARNVTGPAADQLHVWFDDDLLPGYAWSFPLPGGRANIGYGVVRDGRHSGKQMAAIWAGLVDRPHIREALGPDATLEDRHTALPIPAAIDSVRLTHGRVVFVGDAARATDVMTGEGIGQALLTGRLAAEAVIDGSPARYEREVRRHLFADHRMSKVLNGWLSRPWMARGAVRLVDTNDWTRRHFVRWMFEDEHRAVLFTPRRWHRDFLRRPGTYLDRT